MGRNRWKQNTNERIPWQPLGCQGSSGISARCNDSLARTKTFNEMKMIIIDCRLSLEKCNRRPTVILVDNANICIKIDSFYTYCVYCECIFLFFHIGIFNYFKKDVSQAVNKENLRRKNEIHVVITFMVANILFCFST